MWHSWLATSFRTLSPHLLFLYPLLQLLANPRVGPLKSCLFSCVYCHSSWNTPPPPLSTVSNPTWGQNQLYPFRTLFLMISRGKNHAFLVKSYSSQGNEDFLLLNYISHGICTFLFFIKIYSCFLFHSLEVNSTRRQTSYLIYLIQKTIKAAWVSVRPPLLPVSPFCTT